MMVQKNVTFCQREEVTGWKLPSVHIAFEFHTGVSRLKFHLDKYEMVDFDGSWTLTHDES